MSDDVDELPGDQLNSNSSGTQFGTNRVTSNTAMCDKSPIKVVQKVRRNAAIAGELRRKIGTNQ